MARIAGVDIPREKRVEVALTYIFGVGPHVAKRVLTIANVDPNLRVKNLNDEQIGRLRDVLDKEAKVEGRSEEHTSELQSRLHLVCRLLLEKKKKNKKRKIKAKKKKKKTKTKK